MAVRSHDAPPYYAERLQALGKRYDAEVDKGADRRVEMERDEGVHFESMEEGLDED